MQKNSTLLSNILENPLPWVVQALGVVLFVGNLYLASLLFPLVRDIDKITNRVEAIEKRNENLNPLVDRFLQLEERDKNLIETVTEIKEDIRDIKNHLNVR